MKGYIIKVTILSGRHTGHTYFLKKGGYVHDEGQGYEWKDYAYMSLASAKTQCTKMAKYNEQSYRVERMDEEIWVKRGHEPKKWFIYEHESYEPYEISVIE